MDGKIVNGFRTDGKRRCRPLTKCENQAFGPRRGMNPTACLSSASVSSLTFAPPTDSSCLVLCLLNGLIYSGQRGTRIFPATELGLTVPAASGTLSGSSPTANLVSVNIKGNGGLQTPTRLSNVILLFAAGERCNAIALL
jgi:hypothetical protein